MVDQDRKASTRSRGGPLKHLLVAVGVAEGRDRPLADELLDRDRLALLVVEEVDVRKANEHWRPVPQLVADLAATPTTWSGGTPYIRSEIARMNSMPPPETT